VQFSIEVSRRRTDGSSEVIQRVNVDAITPKRIQARSPT
jgi:hypothetical protein